MMPLDMIHLQNYKFVLNSIRKLTYNFPKRKSLA